MCFLGLGRGPERMHGRMGHLGAERVKVVERINPGAPRHLFLFSCVRAKLLQSCPTLCDPMDCRPPGSSVHGILQARILEWVATPSSKGSSQPRD